MQHRSVGVAFTLSAKWLFADDDFVSCSALAKVKWAFCRTSHTGLSPLLRSSASRPPSLARIGGVTPIAIVRRELSALFIAPAIYTFVEVAALKSRCSVCRADVCVYARGTFPPAPTRKSLHSTWFWQTFQSNGATNANRLYSVRFHACTHMRSHTHAHLFDTPAQRSTFSLLF